MTEPASVPSSASVVGEEFDRDWSFDELATRSRQGWAVRVLGRASTHAVQLAVQLILARLLLPAEFGVIAMVTSAIGVAAIFRDVGLSAATIRHPGITASQVSSLFWVNAGLGAALTLVMMISAAPLARFYGDPRAHGIALALSAAFFLGSLSTQHFALLRRGLRFRELTAIEFLSAFAGGAVAVSLAWLGLSYWALVDSVLVTAGMRGILAWKACPFRPGRPRRNPSIRPLLSFGGNVMIFALLGYLAQNLHNVMIGRAFGATEAGLYARGFLLVQLLLAYVLEPLNEIATAALARLAGDPVHYREYYLKAVSSVVVLIAPAALFGVLYAYPIILVLLGPGWEESAGILQRLSLGLVPQALCYTSGWIYLSLGDTRRMMQWGMGGWSVLFLMMLGGLPWGIGGIASSYSLGMYLLLWPCMRLAYHGTAIRFVDLLAVVWPPVTAAFLATLPLFALDRIAPGWSGAVALAASASLFGGAYLVVLGLGLRPKTMLTPPTQIRDAARSILSRPA